MNLNIDKVYFPGLNFLRFIAAATVVIYHTENIKRYYPASYHLVDYPFIENCGQMAVNFFFVLSGFLITYLLLREKNTHNTVFIKHFYMRRILRIWPIYYIVFFTTCIFLFSTDSLFKSLSSTSIALNIVILPNIADLFGQDMMLRHLWSIGVEEQFYIIWPLLIKFFKPTLKVSVIFISIFVILNILVWGLIKVNIYDKETLISIYRLLSNIRMHCLVLGSIGACLFYYNHKSLTFIYHPVTQALTYIVTALILFSNFRFPAINNEIYCSLFLIIILNISSNPKSFFKLEYSWTGFLGKISYGMYMYHFFAVKISIFFFTITLGNHLNSISFILLAQFSALSLTILFASSSYYFIEKKILNYKSNFSKVESISAK
jgi:peptidoglycan/LPS O-acetylase OafA/YrhL